jgi:hypothetical protein
MLVCRTADFPVGPVLNAKLALKPFRQPAGWIARETTGRNVCGTLRAFAADLADHLFSPRPSDRPHNDLSNTGLIFGTLPFLREPHCTRGEEIQKSRLGDKIKTN